ncbi:MAG: hypothetical protein EBV15_06960 [Bacteroidetes bacterium]|nr:hypothetical protein [Bacteroidota bacterium]
MFYISKLLILGCFFKGFSMFGLTVCNEAIEQNVFLRQARGMDYRWKGAESVFYFNNFLVN